MDNNQTDKLLKELRESEEKYRRLHNFNQRILDTAPVSIMVIDTEQRISAVNKYFLNFSGSDEPVGRHIYDINFFTRENLIEAYQDLLITGKPFSRIDCQTVNKKGEIKFINIIAVPLKGPDGKIEGAISMATDNTDMHFSRSKLIALNRELEKEVIERRIAEKQVRLLSEINQKILDNVPVSIVMLNREGEIVAANKMALSLMDRPGKTIIGQKLTHTKEIQENKELSEMFEKLMNKGKPFYYDNLSYIQEDSGERRHLNILAVPLIDGSGKVEGALSMAMDNTEAMEARNNLKKMTEELDKKVKKRTHDLDKINWRLSNILDLKSKFVADASHELRTPLTVIQGNIDLAMMESRTQEQSAPELYSIILEEVERMRTVLADLAMLTNVDTDREQIKYEEVDLREIAKSVERSLRVIALKKDIVFDINCCNEEFRIMGDAKKLEKMISNIVRNAIKYTDSGGGVRINVEKGQAEAQVIVSDNGIGIPREDLPYIFERFYRVDKARAHDEGGSGLGLSIAKWIIDAHGGSIRVASELGKGSVFTICLPFDYKKKNRKSPLYSLF